jgi:hypothetical protein
MRKRRTRAEPLDPKICLECGKPLTPRYGQSLAEWGKKKFCCQPCAGKFNIRIMDGGWNKTSHRASKTKTYRVWQAMKARCGNPNTLHYDRYGGRGILVCPQWKDDFGQFLRDMGEAPPGLTIERVDNDLGYSPGNCVWADRKTQSGNRDVARKITYRDLTLCVTHWARHLGINPCTLRSRIKARGEQRAISELFLSAKPLSRQ